MKCTSVLFCIMGFFLLFATTPLIRAQEYSHGTESVHSVPSEEPGEGRAGDAQEGQQLVDEADLRAAREREARSAREAEEQQKAQVRQQEAEEQGKQDIAIQNAIRDFNEQAYNRTVRPPEPANGMTPEQKADLNEKVNAFFEAAARRREAAARQSSDAREATITDTDIAGDATRRNSQGGRSDDESQPDADGTSKSEATFDLEKATAYIRNHAHGKYMGGCAKAVRLALEHGKLNMKGRPVQAKDYGDFLEGKDFSAIEFDPETDEPRNGDIAVFQSPDTDHPDGHIQMFDGVTKRWISDTVQSRFFPHKAYKEDHDFKVYRHD